MPPLPPWTPEGLLEPGAHATDLAGVYTRFVEDAPNRSHRETLFSCLASYLDLVHPVIGSATAWIDGGFAMRKPDPPGDVDVVLFPDDFSIVSEAYKEDPQRVLSLLTLQDVIIGKPWVTHIGRLQPFGTALDAFVGNDASRDYWREMWSAVKRNGVIIPDQVKGFAEVKL